MALRIVTTEGRSRPQLLCDHCGRQIEDAKDGNYLWPMPEEGPEEPQPVLFAHKKCTPSVEARYEGLMGAIELHELPPRLAANLKMPMKTRSSGGFVHYEMSGHLLALEI